MIGIDLFSGAGGMSIGATQVGIDIKLSVENDPYAAATYAQNHKKTFVYDKDIRKLKTIDIKKNNASSIIFGGPPCQGFSTSNQKTRTTENPNNWLFKEYLRIVKQWKPDWVIVENVKGILELENGIFFEKIIKGLTNAGYTVNFQVLNSADFGVPQKRHRLFIVGSLHGINFKFPKSTHKIPVTVKEAFIDLPILDNGAALEFSEYNNKESSIYSKKMRGQLITSANHMVTKNSNLIIERYKHIPQGGNWENIPDHLMQNYTDKSRCHTGIYHRLNENEPSIVIGNYRKNMLIHPNQDRGLSVREAARLQSFPDKFEFKGSLGYQQQQVGNAVPPLLAKAMFKAILKQNI